jgi:hypothetical protein
MEGVYTDPDVAQAILKGIRLWLDPGGNMIMIHSLMRLMTYSINRRRLAGDQHRGFPLFSLAKKTTRILQFHTLLQNRQR